MADNQATGGTIGQLLSMDWSFGVAVKSSSCQLNSPFVRLHLRVMDNNGKVEDQNLEMDLNEFQVREKLLHISDCPRSSQTNWNVVPMPWILLLKLLETFYLLLYK